MCETWPVCDIKERVTAAVRFDENERQSRSEGVRGSIGRALDTRSAELGSNPVKSTQQNL